MLMLASRSEPWIKAKLIGRALMGGDVKNLIATAVEIYGGLHCAFDNAGVLPPTVPLVEMDASTFDKTSLSI